MTVIRLGQHAAQRRSVVGERPATDATKIRHVGLLAEASELSPGKSCAVLHCEPPLEVARPGKMDAHLVGDLDLSKDEIEVIEDWLADITQQTLPTNPLLHYVLVPPARRAFDKVTQRPKHWRFSCVGFVWKTYEHAGLKLVSLEKISVDRPTLVSTWGEDAVVLAEKTSARYELGLDGPGPWAVLLPAHLFHALERGRAALPFAPTEEHSSFP